MPLEKKQYQQSITQIQTQSKMKKERTAIVSKYNNPQINYQFENFNMIENTDLQDDLKDCNPTNLAMRSIEIKKSESLIHYMSPRKNQVHSKKSSSLAEQILKPVRNSSSYLRGPIEFTLGIE